MTDLHRRTSKSFRPEMMDLEDRKLMAIDIMMVPSLTAIIGQDHGNPALGAFSFTNGSSDSSSSGSSSSDSSSNGSSSGDSSSNGSSSSDSSSGGSMPDGLSQDIALINQNANLTVNGELLPFSYLMLNGALNGHAPWDVLRPGQMENTSSSYSGTETAGCYTITTIVHSFSTCTSDGSPESSDGGGWSIAFEQHTTYSQLATGTDSNGRSSISISTGTLDLTWDVWGESGDSGGPTRYKVTQDRTGSQSYSVTGGPYDEEHAGSNDDHLMAEGVVGTDGTLESGDFTYSGDISNLFSLTDGSGSPSGTGAGYSVSYRDSTMENLSQSGSLIPDSTNRGTDVVNSSEAGDISVTDGEGGIAEASRDDADTVTSNCLGSAPPQSGTNPASATKGTVSASDEPTELKVPKGKNTVYVIDKGDLGWWDKTPEERAAYAKKNKIDPTKYDFPKSPTVVGEDMVAALNLPGTTQVVDAGPGVRQIAIDLGNIKKMGPIDVLVLVDHGNGVKGQQLGKKDFIYPSANPKMVTLVAGNVQQGGTLVLCGCSVFTPTSIGDWQKYATSHNISIMGSASDVLMETEPPSVEGVWITLVPGGKPPTITK